MDGRHSPRLGLIAATQQADDEVNVHVKKNKTKKTKKTKQTCCLHEMCELFAKLRHSSQAAPPPPPKKGAQLEGVSR